jgi:hypothetical protein
MVRRVALTAFIFLFTATFALAQTHLGTAPKSIKTAPAVTATTPPTAQPATISGLASSGRNCLTPAAIGTHYLGWIDERARITITFSADFDPVASATIMRFGQRAADGLVDGYDLADDDSGGGFNPRIDVDAPHGGYLVLFVSPYANAGPGGCYFYKVEIRTP